MFKALQAGQVSRVIPIIGSLIPLLLLLEGVYQGNLDLNQIWAIAILVLGLVFLTMPDWRGKITRKEVFYELIASILFALSYLILRQAYLQEQFLAVFVSSRLILIPIGVLIFIIPHLRHRVLTKKGPKLNFFSKAGALFLIGQAAGGSSELLLTFSVSLATPALVNSLQGVQYIFLFLFSLILAKKYPAIFTDHLSPKSIAGKILGIILIGFGLFILSFSHPTNKPELGVTFSPRYAQSLGLNPQTTYTKLLDDLKVKKIRLPIYWDLVELIPGQYNFQDLKWYIDTAQTHQAKIILVVGQKVPRWPECFLPTWTQTVSPEQKNLHLLQLISQEVNRFKDHPALMAWQVENEPLLNYGVCPKPDQKRLQDEVVLVRSQDPKHPVLITSSGELSSWLTETQLGDQFGTTLYRTVWDKWIGYFNYPIPPVFYQLKYNLAKIFAPQNNQALVIELQAEPWVPAEKQIFELTPTNQQQIFPAEKISQNFEYAKLTQFSPIYFWGVEWWYYMNSHGYPKYINLAKKIFTEK